MVSKSRKEFMGFLLQMHKGFFIKEQIFISLMVVSSRSALQALMFLFGRMEDSILFAFCAFWLHRSLRKPAQLDLSIYDPHRDFIVYGNPVSILYPVFFSTINPAVLNNSDLFTLYLIRIHTRSSPPWCTNSHFQIKVTFRASLHLFKATLISAIPVLEKI